MFFYITLTIFPEFKGYPWSKKQIDSFRSVEFESKKAGFKLNIGLFDPNPI